MASFKRGVVFLFHLLFFFFIASFFLTLGSDETGPLGARMGVGGGLLVGFYLCFRKEIRSLSLKSLSLWFFLSFFIFELIRFVWAFWRMALGAEQKDSLILLAHLSSPLVWAFYLGFFSITLVVSHRRKWTERLLWLASWCGFLLALSALPPLLRTGSAGYIVREGRGVFFPPVLYSHWIFSKYLLGHYAHPNHAGDVIALGFFPAAGLFLYGLHGLHRKKLSPTSLGLVATFTGATALAVILFFSRGTILSFSIAFALFFLVTLVKFPSRTQLIFSGAVFVAVLIFLIWAGNLPGVWKELGTLKTETNVTERTSFSTNREGARRGLRIYRDHPLWGVGTEGYAIVSERYATPGSEQLYMAKVRTMNHFLQILAEEGTGALLYFLFLGAYFVEVVSGLLGTKSRFQFMAGLSLVMGVVMILIHSSIHFLMEQFSISMLVYIYMGASLGVLSKDFQR